MSLMNQKSHAALSVGNSNFTGGTGRAPTQSFLRNSPLPPVNSWSNVELNNDPAVISARLFVRWHKLRRLGDQLELKVKGEEELVPKLLQDPAYPHCWTFSNPQDPWGSRQIITMVSLLAVVEAAEERVTHLSLVIIHTDNSGIVTYDVTFPISEEKRKGLGRELKGIQELADRSAARERERGQIRA